MDRGEIYSLYSYVNNNPLSRIDPSGFDDLDPITVIGTPIVDLGKDFIGGIGDLFDFGGGSSHMSASQQAAQAHGINLSKSLPQYAGGSFQADAVNTLSVYQDVGATYGIDPNDVRLGVTPLAADPSVENEIDGATVTASRASQGDFNFAAIGRTPAFTAIGLPMKVAAGGVLGAPLLAAGVGILPFAAEGAAELSGLGDLTTAEAEQIQAVVNQAGRPLNVVGSAASGTRTALSDIDYVVSPGSMSYFEGLESQLPGLDVHGIIPGAPNPFIGPSIPFYPSTFP